jgi:hypothetical protein
MESEGSTCCLKGLTKDAGDPELADTTAQLGLVTSSRFEFEAHKGIDGTKILMVEWNTSPETNEQSDSDPRPADGADGASRAPATETQTRTNTGDANDGWEVSWEGKTATFPTRDRDAGTRKRLYFLLPPGAHVPPIVTITHMSGTKLTTKPLPAIFPDGLVSENISLGVLRKSFHAVQC